MTGPEHYQEAEQMLITGGDRNVARAQVHATLALAAATAMNGFDAGEMRAEDFNAWDRVCGVRDDES